MTTLNTLISARSLGLKTGPKAALKELIIYGGANGEAWPSYDTLADAVGCSKRSVIRHVNLLEKVGFIKRELRPWRNGGFKTYFTICLNVIMNAAQTVVTKMHKIVDSVVTKRHQKGQIIKEKESRPSPSSRPTATRRENRPVGLDFDPKHGAPGQKEFDQRVNINRNPAGKGFSSAAALLRRLTR